jgi:hypothetical protein
LLHYYITLGKLLQDFFAQLKINSQKSTSLLGFIGRVL